MRRVLQDADNIVVASNHPEVELFAIEDWHFVARPCLEIKRAFALIGRRRIEVEAVHGARIGTMIAAPGA
jgi:hypothetical protein